MNSSPLRFVRHAASTLVLVAGILQADTPAAQTGARDLPAAEALLDRHVEVTGGQEAHRKLTTRRSRGKLTVDQAGHKFEATIERYAQAPNRSHLRVESELFFQITATDGKQAWQWRAGHSHGEQDEHLDAGDTTLLAGPERARVIETARFHSAAGWRTLFPQVETLGVAEVEGRPAFEVRVTPAGGAPYSHFYDQELGLLVKTARTVESSHRGKLEMESFLGEYREFDGVRLPTRIRQLLKSEDMGPGTQVWTYTDIAHGVKVPTGLFTLPEELRGQVGETGDGVPGGRPDRR